MATSEKEHELPKPQKQPDENPFRAMAEMFHKLSSTGAKGEDLKEVQKQMVEFLIATDGLPKTKDEPETGAGPDHANDGQVASTVSLDTRFYKLPSFSGDCGKGDSSFDLWQFEVQCLLDADRNMDVIGQSIRRSLRGYAVETVMRIGSRTTPAQIIAKLRSLYGVVDEQETLLENFYSAHQSPEECVTDWACRLEGY
ncbi:hypothetical protein KP79_PYT24878 [Mizuhopecten yessoensis]|uniref:Uncharacterized protein n=1 Tax=Mizuhopecten yessoensis TaxID=6573 RepID=A0A210Q4N4_MIZYE|nr:hypothetical protein KP79_PYT24878 [Mizuhopecten yessoensis]